MDPTVVALAGVVSTLAGVLYKALLARAERAERAEEFWRARALTNIGMTDIALEEGEKRSQP